MRLQELLKILLAERPCAERKNLTCGGANVHRERRLRGNAAPKRLKSVKYGCQRIAMTDLLQHNCARVTGPSPAINSISRSD